MKPVGSHRRRTRTALALAAAVAILVAGASACRQALADRDAATVHIADTVGQAPPATPGLNQPVRDGVFQFTVLSFSCGRAELVNGWLRARPQGQFCVAEVRVTNVGTVPQRFADGFQRAYGPDRTRYAADTGAGVVVNGNGEAIWNVVNPGNGLTASVVFDIPTTATITVLEVHDSLLSRGAAVLVAA